MDRRLTLRPCRISTIYQILRPDAPPARHDQGQFDRERVIR